MLTSVGSVIGSLIQHSGRHEIALPSSLTSDVFLRPLSLSFFFFSEREVDVTSFSLNPDVILTASIAFSSFCGCRECFNLSTCSDTLCLSPGMSVKKRQNFAACVFARLKRMKARGQNLTTVTGSGKRRQIRSHGINTYLLSSPSVLMLLSIQATTHIHAFPLIFSPSSSSFSCRRTISLLKGSSANLCSVLALMRHDSEKK